MSTAAAAAAIRYTPLRIVSCSDSAAMRCGIHWSSAMFDITRGPSTKPVCAATNSSVPSEISVIVTNTTASMLSPAKLCASTAFIVTLSFGVGITPGTSRYASRMPLAVIASEVAISSIVRLAVRTRGSRMMPMPLDTASMPVNVPPPNEKARMNTSAIPSRPADE